MYMSVKLFSLRWATAVADYGEVKPTDVGEDSDQHKMALCNFTCISKF